MRSIFGSPVMESLAACATFWIVAAETVAIAAAPAPTFAAPETTLFLAATAVP